MLITWQDFDLKSIWAPKRYLIVTLVPFLAHIYHIPTGAAHFRLAHHFINQFIKDDHESGGSLEGQIGELVDAPSLDTMNEWRNLAGDVVYGDCINFNNGSTDDDEDWDYSHLL